jgi:xanthine dehydrogenase accessory factor
MFDQFLSKAAELLANGESFAVAVVVRYLAPISGKPGDKAIIFANGQVWGWIGGGCAQPVVVKEALKSLEDGEPRLIRISPSSSSEENIVEYAMTCQSGGALEIYIEPVLPKPHVVILGRSPAGQILAKLAKAINFHVSVAARGADRNSFPDADSISKDLDLTAITIGPQTLIVVSTQGDGDEDALEQALKTSARYVTFIASKAKAAKVLDVLKEKGLSAEQVARLRAPAGLKIHSSSPEEIAVSILAEMVQHNKIRPAQHAVHAVNPVVDQSEAKDPICGMTVDAASARYRSEFGGQSFYFCCAGCKQKFDEQSEGQGSTLLVGPVSNRA